MGGNKKNMDGPGNNAPGSGAPYGASLPGHSIRVSGRARHIRLRMLPGKGLEIVLPQNTNPDCVPLVLERHRGWIEKQLARAAVRPSCQESEGLVPEQILLKGGLEKIHIRRVVSREGPQVLLCPAREDDLAGVWPPVLRPPALHRDLFLREDSPEYLLRCLREWIREEARLYLGSMLEALAKQHGFSYCGFAVRFQRSRWGSCSAKGNISLNACLLFLPLSLARYILLHELCHTRQLNHSRAFWKQLFAVEPEALMHDKAMRRAWRHVPFWIFT
jgi:predicted metal-dependent hydrolase